MLSGPVAFVLSMFYCWFLTRAVRRTERIRRVIRARKSMAEGMRIAVQRLDRLRRLVFAGSLVVLGLFLVELMLLFTFGTVRSRAVLGPGFYVAHSALFFLCTPALANVLVLREGGWFARRWYFAPVICAPLAFFLVLLQYHVSEALYGLEGISGRYS
jgi:hypothetical protein